MHSYFHKISSRNGIPGSEGRESRILPADSRSILTEGTQNELDQQPEENQAQYPSSLNMPDDSLQKVSPNPVYNILPAEAHSFSSIATRPASDDSMSKKGDQYVQSGTYQKDRGKATPVIPVTPVEPVIPNVTSQLTIIEKIRQRFMQTEPQQTPGQSINLLTPVTPLNTKTEHSKKDTSAEINQLPVEKYSSVGPPAVPGQLKPQKPSNEKYRALPSEQDASHFFTPVSNAPQQNKLIIGQITVEVIKPPAKKIEEPKPKTIPSKTIPKDFSRIDKLSFGLGQL